MSGEGEDTQELPARPPPPHTEREVADADVPTAFGRFEVRGELGRGAMGRVLEAFDPSLERVVALKVVAVDDSNPAMRERLLTEARLASKLEHPNIVPVYEMGWMEGWLYFAMRCIQGRALSDVLGGRARGEDWAQAWTRRRLLGAFLSLCRAVGYAHGRGVLHQDLKPGNVMLGELGEVQLLDWGIARSVRHDPALEQLSSEPTPTPRSPVRPWERERVWGTPGYMSPERIRGGAGALDARADIWALGVILYEIITLSRAFTGPTPMAVLVKILDAPQLDPRVGAHDVTVPDEIAEIVLKATEARVGDRYESVADLVAAMDSHLDGSRRRERAARHLGNAEVLWQASQSLTGERRLPLGQIAEEEKVVPEWASLTEKARLWALRRQLRDLEPERAALFGRAVGAAERAVTEDPGSVLARRFLARAYWSRYLEAEISGDRINETYFLSRVNEWDDGSLTSVRSGEGTLSLRTEPAGAEVLCQRVDRDPVVFALGEPIQLGATPLDRVPLAMGSYVLTLRHAGFPDVTYPVFLSRNEWWDSGAEPVVLPPADAVADGFVYVPGGPFRSGGDMEAQDALPAALRMVGPFAIARFPVTVSEYCEFINALHRDDPEAAWARVPRSDEGVQVAVGQFWERPEPGQGYVVPEADRMGDRWDPQWPVISVSWDDAVAYCEWRSTRDGRRYALPTEQQWEKAARGVDARLFPWGDEIDPSLCHMRLSREGRPQPEPVGSFPTDVSVYGMRDIAGGVRDWCGDLSYGVGADERRPVRGGSWDGHGAYCRIAHRTGYLPWFVSTSFGMRLVQEMQS